MSKDHQQFKGAQITGVSCGFNVKIRLNAAEKLEIYLQHRDNFETYYYTVKPQDIKKQNIKNHCDFIDTGSEIYQYIQLGQRQGVPFDDLVRIDSKGKVSIRLEIQINLQTSSKRKVITYEFQAVKQTQNAVEKLRAQINSLANQKLRFQQDMQKRVRDLQEQNIKLKNQIRNIEKIVQHQPKHKANQSQILRFATNPAALVVKNEVFIQTANKLNIILFGENLSPQRTYEWKIRVCHKMVLIFGVGTVELTQLQNQALLEEIENQRLLKRDYFNGGQIITCTFEEGDLKFIIEQVDIEEEEGSTPEPNYNMRRACLTCKKLNKIDQLYPCFGLHFGGRVEILSYKTIK